MCASPAAPNVDVLRHLNIDRTSVAKHVMRPKYVEGVTSLPEVPRDRARSKFQFDFHFDRYYGLDIEGFGRDVQTGLEQQTAGYIFMVQQRDSTVFQVENGFAKMPNDFGESWTANVAMHIASCSKLITAIAMSRALSERGISIDTPIIGFLPVYWAKGINIDKITFRLLMTHKSGYTGNDITSCDFEFMKEKIAEGVETSDMGLYNYLNLNYGLCRILLASVVGDVPPGSLFPDPNDAYWDVATIQSYCNYVTNYVFAPSGVSGLGFSRQDNDALAYNFPANGHGWDSGDLSTLSGAVGWHISAQNLLRVMGTFRRHGIIMSASNAQDMLDNQFGIDYLSASPLGNLYGKKGYWGNNSLGTVEQSLLYFLPHDMELVTLVNSRIGTGKGADVQQVILNAYMANLKMRFTIPAVQG